MKLLFLLLLIPSTLYARSRSDFAGNGGDVVFCASGAPFSLKVLEEFEAENFFGWVPLEVGAFTYEKIAEKYLSRAFEFRMESLRESLLMKISQFDENKREVYGKELRDIHDSDHILIPAGCKVRQAIRLQLEKPRGGFVYEEKYIVNGDIWRELSEKQRAILILHEVFYEWYIENLIKKEERGLDIEALKNSKAIRFFNALVFSGNLNLKYGTDIKFKELLESVHADNEKFYFEKERHIFNPRESFFYASGNLKSGPAIDENKDCLKGSRKYILNSALCGVPPGQHYGHLFYRYHFFKESGETWSKEIEIVFNDSDSQLCTKRDTNCLTFNDLRKFWIKRGVDGPILGLELLNGRSFQIRYRHLVQYVSLDMVLDMLFELSDKTSISCSIFKGWGIPRGSVVLIEELTKNELEQVKCRI